jgi:hypothetical protein
MTLSDTPHGLKPSGVSYPSCDMEEPMKVYRKREQPGLLFPKVLDGVEQLVRHRWRAEYAT